MFLIHRRFIVDPPRIVDVSSDPSFISSHTHSFFLFSPVCCWICHCPVLFLSILSSFCQISNARYWKPDFESRCAIMPYDAVFWSMLPWWVTLSIQHDTYDASNEKIPIEGWLVNMLHHYWLCTIDYSTIDYSTIDYSTIDYAQLISCCLWCILYTYNSLFPSRIIMLYIFHHTTLCCV